VRASEGGHARRGRSPETSSATTREAGSSSVKEEEDERRGKEWLSSSLRHRSVKFTGKPPKRSEEASAEEEDTPLPLLIRAERESK